MIYLKLILFWDFINPLAFLIALFLIIEIVMRTIKIANSSSDEPMVPKFNPPFSSGFVSKSPKVAPNGLVKTKANQNNNIAETLRK